MVVLYDDINVTALTKMFAKMAIKPPVIKPNTNIFIMSFTLLRANGERWFGFAVLFVIIDLLFNLRRKSMIYYYVSKGYCFFSKTINELQISFFFLLGLQPSMGNYRERYMQDVNKGKKNPN